MTGFYFSFILGMSQNSARGEIRGGLAKRAGRRGQACHQGQDAFVAAGRRPAVSTAALVRTALVVLLCHLIKCSW